MLQHLGRALREKRKAQKIKLIRIAYQLDKSEAALSRFEQGKTWPNDIDQAIAVYADELGEDAVDLWAAALELWRADNLSESPAREAAEAAERLAQTAERKRGSNARDQAARKRRGA